MLKSEKENIINDLSEKFSNANFFYVADSSGLTVAEINKFRSLCYEKGLEYRIVKNTLIKKALEKAKIDSTQLEDEGILKGTSGLLFSKDNAAPNVPAKLLKEFRKNNEKPLLKGAIIDSEAYFGDDQINPLSELKSKEELVGEIIGLLQSPIKNLMSSLESGKNTLSGIMTALSDRDESTTESSNETVTEAKEEKVEEVPEVKVEATPETEVKDETVEESSEETSVADDAEKEEGTDEETEKE